MSEKQSTIFDSEEPKKSRKREATRLWAKRNSEHCKAYGSEYRRKNRALLAQKMRDYRKRKPGTVATSLAKHRAKNRQKFRDRYRRERREAIIAYGGRCACCGETGLCFLTIDHVRNDGAAHRNANLNDPDFHGNGYAIYRYLRKHRYPQDGRFQVLCYNCNCCKQHDPVGHRAAHPNAINIDGLGDLSARTVGRRPQSN